MLLRISAAQLSGQLRVFLLNIDWRYCYSSAAVPHGLSPPHGQSHMSSSNEVTAALRQRWPSPTEEKGQQAA